MSGNGIRYGERSQPPVHARAAMRAIRPSGVTVPFTSREAARP
jgi:hypothetical protein